MTGTENDALMSAEQAYPWSNPSAHEVTRLEAENMHTEDAADAPVNVPSRQAGDGYREFGEDRVDVADEDDE